MKKNLLLLICVLLIQINRAQNWCQPGATWHYKHYFLGAYLGSFQGSTFIDGVSDFQYVNDTVVNGVTCNHIRGTFRGIWNAYMQPATVNNYRNYYTYQNNKVIYVWSGGSFDTIVNFNAAVGDKWRRNTLAGVCNGRGTMTVIDTGRVTINNLSLKKIVTAYSNTYTTANGTFSVAAVDTIIERIMSRVNFMFPMYCEINNPPPVDNPVIYNGEFKCYGDNNFPLYKRAGVSKCEYDAVGLRELSVNHIPVRLYPNPSTGSVILESEHFAQQDHYTVSILNALGQCIFQKEAEALNNQLRLSPEALSAGIYYLQISNKNGLLAAEKMIRTKD
jgi:hypothetical protein